jgi:hypothetical protein
MRWLLVLLSLVVAQGQEAKEGTAGDAQRLVTIQQIVVEGTRLPARSVVRLAQSNS